MGLKKISQLAENTTPGSTDKIFSSTAAGVWKYINPDNLGGGSGSIAYVDTTFASDDATNHEYKTLRGAINNEPAGTTFILTNGQSFVTGGTGTLTIKEDCRFIVYNPTPLATSIVIQDSIAMSGSMPIVINGPVLRLGASITSFTTTLKESILYFLLNDDNSYSVDTMDITFMGFNISAIFPDPLNGGPHTQYISDLKITGTNAKIMHTGSYADEIYIRLNNTDITGGFYGFNCAFCAIVTDENSKISGDSSGSGLESFVLSEWLGTPLDRNSFIHFGKKDAEDPSDLHKGKLSGAIICSASASANFTTLAHLIGGSDPSGMGYNSRLMGHAYFYIDASNFTSAELGATTALKYCDQIVYGGSKLEFNVATTAGTLFDAETELFKVDALTGTNKSGQLPIVNINTNDVDVLSFFNVYVGASNMYVLSITGTLEANFGNVKLVSTDTNEMNTILFFSNDGAVGNILNIFNVENGSYNDCYISNMQGGVVNLRISEGIGITNAFFAFVGENTTLNFKDFSKAPNGFFVDTHNNTINNLKAIQGIGAASSVNLVLNGDYNVVNNALVYNVTVDGNSNKLVACEIENDFTTTINANDTIGVANSVTGTLTNNGATTLFPATVNKGGI